MLKIKCKTFIIRIYHCKIVVIIYNDINFIYTLGNLKRRFFENDNNTK